jgi:hypothetical protein
LSPTTAGRFVTAIEFDVRLPAGPDFFVVRVATTVASGESEGQEASVLAMSLGPAPKLRSDPGEFRCSRRGDFGGRPVVL